MTLSAQIATGACDMTAVMSMGAVASAPLSVDRPQAVADDRTAQAAFLAAFGAAMGKSGLLRAVVASLGRGGSALSAQGVLPLPSRRALPALRLPGLYGSGAGGGGPGRQRRAS
jgi:hypothetical protein